MLAGFKELVALDGPEWAATKEKGGDEVRRRLGYVGTKSPLFKIQKAFKVMVVFVWICVCMCVCVPRGLIILAVFVFVSIHKIYLSVIQTTTICSSFDSSSHTPFPVPTPFSPNTHTHPYDHQAIQDELLDGDGTGADPLEFADASQRVLDKVKDADFLACAFLAFLLFAWLRAWTHRRPT